jgi:hypothetical protein
VRVLPCTQVIEATVEEYPEKVKNGCEWTVTTVSSLKSEPKSNMVRLDMAMAIASSAAEGVDCDAR